MASLKGKYAFRRSGTINLVGGPNCQGFTDCGPIAEMGVATYDGNGTRGLIRTTRSTAGEIRPWLRARTERNLHRRSELYGIILRYDRHTQGRRRRR